LRKEVIIETENQMTANFLQCLVKNAERTARERDESTLPRDVIFNANVSYMQTQPQLFYHGANFTVNSLISVKLICRLYALQLVLEASMQLVTLKCSGSQWLINSSTIMNLRPKKNLLLENCSDSVLELDYQ
jgi:hypothetical protein